MVWKTRKTIYICLIINESDKSQIWMGIKKTLKMYNMGTKIVVFEKEGILFQLSLNRGLKVHLRLSFIQ